MERCVEAIWRNDIAMASQMDSRCLVDLTNGEFELSKKLNPASAFEDQGCQLIYSRLVTRVNGSFALDASPFPHTSTD
jgi:hypothetical protein